MPRRNHHEPWACAVIIMTISKPCKSALKSERYWSVFYYMTSLKYHFWWILWMHKVLMINSFGVEKSPIISLNMTYHFPTVGTLSLHHSIWNALGIDCTVHTDKNNGKMKGRCWTNNPFQVCKHHKEFCWDRQKNWYLSYLKFQFFLWTVKIKLET